MYTLSSDNENNEIYTIYDENYFFKLYLKYYKYKRNYQKNN